MKHQNSQKQNGSKCTNDRIPELDLLNFISFYGKAVTRHASNQCRQIVFIFKAGEDVFALNNERQ